MLRGGGAKNEFRFPTARTGVVSPLHLKLSTQTIGLTLPHPHAILEEKISATMKTRKRQVQVQIVAISGWQWQHRQSRLVMMQLTVRKSHFKLNQPSV